ncbi:hypothetical protein Sjap_022906 [Stephania japonica]|uniref:Uncharacterized protein n=1 Tax=Stephania japonica TaxID=461633 RepID=A0AAP0HTH8_9MAGN
MKFGIEQHQVGQVWSSFLMTLFNVKVITLCNSHPNDMSFLPLKLDSKMDIFMSHEHHQIQPPSAPEIMLQVGATVVKSWERPSVLEAKAPTMTGDDQRALNCPVTLRIQVDSLEVHRIEDLRLFEIRYRMNSDVDEGTELDVASRPSRITWASRMPVDTNAVKDLNDQLRKNSFHKFYTIRITSYMLDFRNLRELRYPTEEVLVYHTNREVSKHVLQSSTMTTEVPKSKPEISVKEKEKEKDKTNSMSSRIEALTI